MTARIRLDFESLADAAAALSQPPASPLPSPAPTGRPALESALVSVRDEWRIDSVSSDSSELGVRLSASAEDFVTAEEAAVQELRRLESAFP